MLRRNCKKHFRKSLPINPLHHGASVPKSTLSAQEKNKTNFNQGIKMLSCSQRDKSSSGKPNRKDGTNIEGRSQFHCSLPFFSLDGPLSRLEGLLHMKNAEWNGCEYFAVTCTRREATELCERKQNQDRTNQMQQNDWQAITCIHNNSDYILLPYLKVNILFDGKAGATLIHVITGCTIKS